MAPANDKGRPKRPAGTPKERPVKRAKVEELHRGKKIAKDLQSKGSVSAF